MAKEGTFMADTSCPFSGAAPRRSFLKQTLAAGTLALGTGAALTQAPRVIVRSCPVNGQVQDPGAAILADKLQWTTGAQERLDQVPAGFMRTVARNSAARLAGNEGSDVVTQAHVEAAIQHAVATMNAFMPS
jgi:hypothetical protein